MKYKLAKPLSIHELGQRKNQEDSIFPKLGAATENDRLFILCDGMGGHEAGGQSGSVPDDERPYIVAGRC